jgi:uncharacterized membrane protein
VSEHTAANLPMMEDFPARLATFLEDIATRVRAMTVDRIAKVVRLSTLGLIAAAFGLMAAIFLFLTVFAALAIALGSDAAAWGVLAGLFLIAGALLWSKRSKD